jgi:hypothetical protein
MLVWWKISSGHLCCFPCNMWLMGPFFITWHVYLWMPWCCLVIFVTNYIWNKWGECVSRHQNKCDSLVEKRKCTIHDWCALYKSLHQYCNPNSFYFCCFSQIVPNKFLVLIQWFLDYLHAWCVQWVLQLAKWHIRHGGAWMGTWFEYWFWELEFLNYWHFYHDALLVSWDINLCKYHSCYLPTNHQLGAKIMFWNYNYVQWWA